MLSDLLSIVLGEEPCPPLAQPEAPGQNDVQTTEAHQSWIEKDGRAMGKVGRVGKGQIGDDG